MFLNITMTKMTTMTITMTITTTITMITMTVTMITMITMTTTRQQQTPNNQPSEQTQNAETLPGWTP